MVRINFPCAPEEMMECLVVQRREIKGSETQQAVRLARLITSADALAKALKFEAASLGFTCPLSQTKSK